MLRNKLFTALLVMWFAVPFAHAEDFSTPIGNWVTISDTTHDRAAIIQIYQNNGKLYGKVIKIFPGKDRDPAELCVKCEGPLKNKPVLGMTFLWGFIKTNKDEWSKGSILDPHEGHVYRATMKLVDQGKSLKLRGYWGIFWRTQTWERVL